MREPFAIASAANGAGSAFSLLSKFLLPVAGNTAKMRAAMN